MKKNILLFLVCVFVTASATFAQRCPIGCSCADNTISVACYGAVPDDQAGDSAAIQNGINSLPSSWTLFFPAGVYLVDVPLYINRSNINLTGQGIQSELKTPRDWRTEWSLLNLPAVDYQSQCDELGNPRYNTPTNIVIEKLSLNGDFNAGRPDCDPSGDCGELNGIFIRQGENITIRDVLVKSFSREGISIAVGWAIPKNISMVRLRTQKIRRTAVHFGFGENIRLEDSSIEDQGSDEWVQMGLPVGGPAIDLEVEGSDFRCPAIEGNYRDGYLLDSTIKNTLIMNPTETTSKGGIAISPANGPVRNVEIKGNVVINTTGLSSLGDIIPSSPPVSFGVRNPRVGESRRIRQLDVSQNWFSNLHYSGDGTGAHAFTFNISGDAADAYGPNDIRFNDNVITFFGLGQNYRALEFSGVKEFYGSNNKLFRPYQVIPDGNAWAGPQGFVWSKEHSTAAPINLQITSTLDNGWFGSRVACYDPSRNPAMFYCSLKGEPFTWINNPNRTPEGAPIITNARVLTVQQVLVSVQEPNNQPVRVMIYRNGLPIGLRTLTQSSGVINIPAKAQHGDEFYLQAFNENGWSGEYSFTY